MFRKILVPLDGSKLAEAALPVVEKLVRGADAEVTLFIVGQRTRATDARHKGPRRALPIAGMTGPVHGVIEAAVPDYAESPGQAIERREHELLEYLEDVSHDLKAAGIRVTRSVHFGPAANEIIELAQRGSFEIIVMATHGRSGLRDVIHGSVTAAVIRSGVAPVLVVRPIRPSPEANRP